MEIGHCETGVRLQDRPCGSHQGATAELALAARASDRHNGWGTYAVGRDYRSIVSIHDRVAVWGRVSIEHHVPGRDLKLYTSVISRLVSERSECGVGGAL